MTTDLVPKSRAVTITEQMPAILERAGQNAVFAADEFFRATISNPHTRRAYGRAMGRFLSWCEDQGLALEQISPGVAGQYIYELEVSGPSKNQALAALRHFFDVLTVRHAVAFNPFSSVRGVKHDGREGKTPEISVVQARQLFKLFEDDTSVIGKRDKALLGVLAYTGARIGAIAQLKLGDFQDQGEQWVLHFDEKGGKARQVPVRRDLEAWIKEYMEAAGIEDAPAASPLFRPAEGKPRQLVERFYTAHSMRQQITRRLKQAGLPAIISPHSFRVMVVSDLLSQDMLPKEVQYLVGHSDPSTTQIYDRRQQKVSRNLVERISV